MHIGVVRRIFKTERGPLFFPYCAAVITTTIIAIAVTLILELPPAALHLPTAVIFLDISLRSRRNLRCITWAIQLLPDVQRNPNPAQLANPPRVNLLLVQPRRDAHPGRASTVVSVVSRVVGCDKTRLLAVIVVQHPKAVKPRRARTAQRDHEPIHARAANLNTTTFSPTATITHPPSKTLVIGHPLQRCCSSPDASTWSHSRHPLCFLPLLAWWINARHTCRAFLLLLLLLPPLLLLTACEPTRLSGPLAPRSSPLFFLPSPTAPLLQPPLSWNLQKISTARRARPTAYFPHFCTGDFFSKLIISPASGKPVDLVRSCNCRSRRISDIPFGNVCAAPPWLPLPFESP